MLDDLRANTLAYLPPRSALWLWIGAPLLIALVYFITSLLDNGRKKRLREAEIWRSSITPDQDERKKDNKDGAPYRPDPAKKAKAEAKPKKVAGPPRVSALPGMLHGALIALGGGKAIAHYELVRGLAFLSLMESSGTAGSDFQAVTAKLEQVAPLLELRPLPEVDGQRVANTGVQFKKDPELMKLFLIEGPNAKAIGQWLSPPIRRALCDLPSAWLRVEGRTVTVGVFGSLTADQIDALVELADTIFAEHGEGGASLFQGSVEAAPAKKSAAASPSKKGAAALDSAAKKKAAGASYRTSTLAETPQAKKKA